MADTINNTPGTQTPATTITPIGGQSSSASAARTARDQSPGGDKNWGKSTMENLGEAYDRASRGVTETYGQAVDYTRSNPGTATLVAFGAGVGIGLLIANSVTSRSRTQRIVPPVMRALSEIAGELFR